MLIQPNSQGLSFSLGHEEERPWELQSWPIFSGTDTKIAIAVYISLVVPSLRIFGSPPLPQAMLKATEINRTVHKHSNLTTLHGGGGGGEGGYFVLSFGICPDIFGQDCRLTLITVKAQSTLYTFCFFF